MKTTASAFAEFGPVAGGDIVLALPFLKGDHGNFLRLGEGLEVGDQRPGHGPHQARGSKQLTAMVAEEAHHAEIQLQLRLIDIQVHAVDALNFERHAVRG